MMLVAAAMSAQSSNAPEFIDPAPGAKMVITMLSDNGLWGVSEQASKTDGSIAPSGGTIVNINTLAQEDISHSSGLSGVSDITDDGNLVVGEANGRPAYWSRTTGKWTTLAIPSGYSGGRLNAVTPDGRRAVGYITPPNDPYGAYPVAYDLTTGSMIDISGVPTKDMQNLDQHQNHFSQITADGKYAVGHLSGSYVLPVAPCSYIYDIDNKTYKIIGFTERPEATGNIYGNWTPHVENMVMVTSANISTNGEWVTGMAYMAIPVEGSEFANEYYVAYVYDVNNDKFEIYPESDYAGWAITNDGTPYIAAPAENPYAYSYVRSGGYYISFEQIFSQVYGIDFEKKMGVSNTGKVMAMSADGNTLVMLTSTDDSYILKLNEPLTKAAESVNLLENFTINPAEGSTISSCNTFTLRFDRRVVANATKTSKIKFTSEDGTASYSPLQTGGFQADGTNVTITFRPRDLEKGKKYTLTIPAGCIYIEGNQKYVNEDITVTYTGRDKSPIELTQAYPADEAAVSGIDLTNNPMILTFDTDVKLVEGGHGYLYRAGEADPFCELNMLAAGKQILCYPIVAQYLYEGTDYVVVIPENVATDISGNGPNKEIRLNYHGAFKRVPGSDDTHIFIDDCSTYNNFLLYEGDHLEPSSIPASWGFMKDSTPWFIVRSSEETTDMAMASHSMYTPAGKADDWMSTPQLYIPDEKCVLQFDAQSYMDGVNYHLKVYALTDDGVYNTLTASIVEKFRNEGELIFDEVLTPGATQEGLEDEWTNYVVELDKYAGKNVYLAFVNENENGSAVFVDNIKVVHDMDFLVTFENAERVVAQSETEIFGSVTITSALGNFSAIKLTLTDAEGNEIDTIEEEGLDLKQGDLYKFRFAKPLPLEQGVINTYYVNLLLDDNASSVQGTIRNMTFLPSKKVVIEEYTGRDCVNCPLGLLAFDYIEERYPGSVIPIGIHTYQSDPLGTGFSAYSEYLGLNNAGAPSGRVNRNTLITYPMINTLDGYSFSGLGIYNDAGVEERLWYDHVREELEQPADLAIDFGSVYNEAASSVTVNCKVRSALNTTGNAINIFAAIVEDNVDGGYQRNGYGTFEDPLLGEWGAGGKYSNQIVVPFTFDDVVRQVWGTTYNGTGGLVPADLKSTEAYDASFTINLPGNISDINNCSVVVMMIEAGSGKVINANIARVGELTNAGIGSVAGEDTGITYSISDGDATVNAPGQVAVSIYDMAGMALGSAHGFDSATVRLNGYRGFAVIRVVAADGKTLAKKVFIR